MEGYILKINFYTDGDFGCSHKDLKYDGDYGYSLFKVWESTKEKEQAITDVISLLKEIKESLGGRDYVVEDVVNMLDRAIESIENNCYCEEYVSGNQDGTEIEFGYGTVNEEKSEIILALTQEEYETLLQNFEWVKSKIIDITKIQN